MESLFKSRKIVSVDYGRRSDERKKIVRNVDLNNDKGEQHVWTAPRRQGFG